MAITRQKQNKEALYKAANLLQDLNNDFVYVGGRIVGLLITDVLEDDLRPTFDIDVAVEITGILAHYELEKKLRTLGFKPEGTVNCRYLHGDTIIDVMHTDGKLQGLNTSWYQDGFNHAIMVNLKKDKSIKILNSVYFIASKLEAFNDRSYQKKDYWDCKDLEDIINVLNGRPELTDEIAASEKKVKHYIVSFIKELINNPKWFDAIKAIARQERSRIIVLNALKKIAHLD